MQAFDDFVRWTRECFNPQLRRMRADEERIQTEESKLNAYQRKILEDMRELSARGAPELWKQSLERVGGTGGVPGIVLRQRIEDELHLIGVREVTITGRNEFARGRCEYFARSFQVGSREPYMKLDNSLIAQRMFELIKERSPFLQRSFELRFPREKLEPPRGSTEIDIISIFESSAFQLMMQENLARSINLRQRAIDKDDNVSRSGRSS